MQKKTLLLHKISSTFLSLLMWTTLQAATPLWTFEPLTTTTVIVPSDGTATVSYLVTNQSNRSTHTLFLKPIPAITQVTEGAGVCGNPFTLPPKGSCTLTLLIDGSQVNQPIVGGPVVCQGGNPLQCYQACAPNNLNISQGLANPSILYGVSGTGSEASNRLFTLSTSTGAATFVMPLGSAEIESGGEALASDGITLYHWTGYPGSNVLYERVNLADQTTTPIPLTGYPFQEEITGAVFYNQADGFLAISRGVTEFMNFSRTGVVTLLGITNPPRIIRGMACFAHRVYAIQNNSSFFPAVPVVIYELDPTNGAIISTSPPVTIDGGFKVNKGIGLTVDPNTGVFYALLGVQGSNEVRKLATINVTTGVAKLIGDADNGSGLSMASIAFQPADPTC